MTTKRQINKVTRKNYYFRLVLPGEAIGYTDEYFAGGKWHNTRCADSIYYSNDRILYRRRVYRV